MSHDEEKQDFAGSIASAKKTPSKSTQRFSFQRLPFHPILFAAYPVLTLYVRNIDEVPLNEIWRSFLMAVLGTAITWTVFALATRHNAKAALAASAIVLIFFSYGHIANLLPENARFVVTPLCLICLGAALVLIYRTSGGLTLATVAANVAALALVAPSILSIGSRAIAGDLYNNPARPPKTKVIAANGQTEVTGQHRGLPNAAKAPAETFPDIYYIILDAYGRTDSLKTFLGYDNTPFVRELESRGFYVPTNSHANYAQTGYCLPAYLNMEYLDTLINPSTTPENLFEVERHLIDDNAAAAFLRNRGYSYVNIWTGTGVTRVDTADVVLENDSIPPKVSFEEEVLQLSAAGSAPRSESTLLGRAADYERHRAFLLTAFHNLDAVANLQSPKFVFAHILAPHPPFVFGPNGERTDPPYPYNEADASQLLELNRISREQYKTGYIGQLKYVNRRILEAVDAILRQSKRRPIIIIQGDHGSRLNMDWTSQSKTEMEEPFSILNAYYVPPEVRQNLYDSVTPVNTFRILFRTLFNANYPNLPDRSFYATADVPLKFTEVTSQLLPPPKH